MDINFSSKPITLIGGYLGAGKTTFINRLLRSDFLPAQTAILVNDFGDINIDEHLIKSASKDERVIGLSNGCVCCSVRDDLSRVLDQLSSMPLERVLLECSGVAEPQKAIRQCHYPGFHPQACVVLVDASSHDKRLKDKYVGSLVAAQVEQADLIVITKTDLNPSFFMDELKPIVTLSDNDSLDTLLNWQGAGYQIEETSKEKSHGLFASSWVQEADVFPNVLADYLDNLPDSVQRAKGFVKTNEGFCEVQVTGGVVQIRKFLEGELMPTSLGLVFIGHNKEELPTDGPNPRQIKQEF